MSKVMWKPGTFVYPIPTVMVSCGTMEKSNIITVAWTGTINTDPYITVLANKVSSLAGQEFQNTIGGANILVPQCPTFWMDKTGDSLATKFDDKRFN